jgi:recombinational DNA repair protein (RecF pathway)
MPLPFSRLPFAAMVLGYQRSDLTFHSASIIDFYRPIKEDITCLSVASLISEIALQVSTPYQTDEYLFDITKASIECIWQLSIICL